MLEEELRGLLNEIFNNSVDVENILKSQKKTFLLITALEKKYKKDINIFGIQKFTLHELLKYINKSIDSENYQLFFNKNCYVESLYEICKSFIIETDFIFLSDWVFNYKCIDKYIYNNINYLNTIDDFSETFGLKLKDEANNQFLKLIFKQIDNEKICLAKIDTYYCPWNKAYKNMHSNHFLIIFDYIEKDKVLLCKDPFASKYEFYEIPYELINDIVITLLCYEKINAVKRMDKKNILKCLLSQNNLIMEIKKSFDNFCKDLKYIKQINELFNSNVEELNIICIKISQILVTRHNIRVILLKHNLADLDNLVKLFEVSYNYWKKINFILLKLLIIKTRLDESLKLIYKYMSIISKVELEIYAEALKLMDNIENGTN